jgi:hypothetical protein
MESAKADKRQQGQQFGFSSMQFKFWVSYQV